MNERVLFSEKDGGEVPAAYEESYAYGSMRLTLPKGKKVVCFNKTAFCLCAIRNRQTICQLKEEGNE